VFASAEYEDRYREKNFALFSSMRKRKRYAFDFSDTKTLNRRKPKKKKRVFDSRVRSERTHVAQRDFFRRLFVCRSSFCLSLLSRALNERTAKKKKEKKENVVRWDEY
jgi:hypothetical protein